MRLDAAVSSCLRPVLAAPVLAGPVLAAPVLAGPVQPAEWLGVMPAAAYLRVASVPGVVGVLAHDAVRLPCAIVLPTTAAELPLTSIAEASGAVHVGGGQIAWDGPNGRVFVRAVREWSPATVAPGDLTPGQAGRALELLRRALADVDVPAIAALGLLRTDPLTAVGRLLGHGPGLTPAGDDILAGFLIGARAFGIDAAGVAAVGVAAAVTALAPSRTTALSAALLWHAARGECIDEVASVVAALGHAARPAGPERVSLAVARLLRVGHTSGAALAAGLSAAASAARADAGAAA